MLTAAALILSCLVIQAAVVGFAGEDKGGMSLSDNELYDMDMDMDMDMDAQAGHIKARLMVSSLPPVVSSGADVSKMQVRAW